MEPRLIFAGAASSDRMLERVLAQFLTFPAVEGAVLLDSEGETVYCCSRNGDEELLRIVGAYQAIVLACAARLDFGVHQAVVLQFERTTILSRHLKDGYFVCIILGKGARFARQHFLFIPCYEQLIQEL